MCVDSIKEYFIFLPDLFYSLTVTTSLMNMSSPLASRNRRRSDVYRTIKKSLFFVMLYLVYSAVIFDI